MHKDAMRSKMDVKLYCAKHPATELKFASDLSKVGASSAYEVNVKIVIHPCEQCCQEVERIQNAVDVLLSVKNGK